MYKGCIVEESLTDNRIINRVLVRSVHISSAEDPAQRWHIYHCEMPLDQIDSLQQYLKQGWYMHFWHSDKMIVLFKDKRFSINAVDKLTWKDAVEYGTSIGIPQEQLDFAREF